MTKNKNSLYGLSIFLCAMGFLSINFFKLSFLSVALFIIILFNVFMIGLNYFLNKKKAD